MKIYKVFVDGKFPFVIGYLLDKDDAESIVKNSNRIAAEPPLNISEIEVFGTHKDLEEACRLLHTCLEWDNGGERDYQKIIEFLNRVEKIETFKQDPKRPNDMESV